MRANLPKIAVICSWVAKYHRVAAAGVHRFDMVGFLLFLVSGGVRDHKVTSCGQVVIDRFGDRDRFIRVWDEVNDAEGQDGDGFAEVRGIPHRVEYEFGLAVVGLQHGAVRVANQNQPAVQHCGGVDVHIDDACLGVDRLGYLVHAAHGRQAGAQVEELAHTLGHQIDHRQAQELAIGLGDFRQGWVGR